MNIIFTVASMAGGGAERVISVLANYLTENGNKVTIIMTAGEQSAYPLDERVIVKSAGERSRGSMYRRFERIIRLRNFLKQEKDAVVVAFGLGSSFFTAVSLFGLKNPYVISERNDPAACPHPHLRNMVYGYADALVFQTEDALRSFPGKLQKKGIVIPNPVSEKVKTAYTGERTKQVVAVGRLEPQKNYSLLLKAYADFQEKFSDYTLHIFGKGYLQDELMKMTEELGIKDTVIFEGFKPDVHEKIQNAAMYVLSSDYEGISNALLEAMALGLPVIATDCPIGGSALCIQNGINGILVPVGDQRKMTEAMCSLAADTGKAKAMGAEAANVRMRFSKDEIGRQWSRMFSEIYKGMEESI